MTVLAIEKMSHPISSLRAHRRGEGGGVGASETER